MAVVALAPHSVADFFMREQPRYIAHMTPPRFHRGITIVEDVVGDGAIVERGELLMLDLQISLSRGDVIHPRQTITLRVGDRHTFAGLSKSVAGMRRGGYRKTRVSPHLAYGVDGIPGKVPPNAVLVCEVWLQNNRAAEA